jgi:hypothetical protein
MSDALAPDTVGYRGGLTSNCAVLILLVNYVREINGALNFTRGSSESHETLIIHETGKLHIDSAHASVRSMIPGPFKLRFSAIGRNNAEVFGYQNSTCPEMDLQLVKLLVECSSI